ncbi:MAG TPA: hypothetical protein PKH07_07985, partial [bacterium]|nr:hypothetical protein [bacterium]
GCDRADQIDVNGVSAGDHISGMLTQASESTLVVSNLMGNSLLRMAELMDVAGLCIAGGTLPEQEFIESAQERGIILIASPYELFETCGRLYERLKAEGALV